MSLRVSINRATFFVTQQLARNMAERGGGAVIDAGPMRDAGNTKERLAC